MFARLIVHKQLESTQDLARELALQGESEGAAVMALEQTAGRGRSGHSWISPPGKNLALSVLLRPVIDPAAAALLGMMASIAVAETVQAFGVPKVELKWPNDVLVNGRKIAGILSEAALTSRAVEYVIIGIGLNVNSEETDFPLELRDSVTSLFLSSGVRQDLEETAWLLLREMDKLYEQVRRKGCGFLPALWAARWAHHKSFVMRDGVRYKAEAIGSDGSLVVLTECGQLRRFTSGQIDVIEQPPQSGIETCRKPD